MSPAPSGSLALQCFKLGDALEIHNRIIFNIPSGTATYMDSKNWMSRSYYSSPKWPQKQFQSINFPGGTCPQIPLVFHVYDAYMLIRHPCIPFPLRKILAMGLHMVSTEWSATTSRIDTQLCKQNMFPHLL